MLEYGIVFRSNDVTPNGGEKNGWLCLMMQRSKEGERGLIFLPLRYFFTYYIFLRKETKEKNCKRISSLLIHITRVYDKYRL